MSVFLIIIGLVIANFGARVFRGDQMEGGQSTLGGLLTLILQLSGWGLAIWGVVKLFT